VKGGRKRLDGSDLLQAMKEPAKQRADGKRAFGLTLQISNVARSQRSFLSPLLALTQAQYSILSFCGVWILQRPRNVARKSNKMAQSLAPIAIIERIASTQD